MKNDEILIIQCQIPMKPQKFDIFREQILKQKESGVILLPYYCTVIAKPKDMDIQVELEKEDDPTPWQFVESSCYSPVDQLSKEYHAFCDGCGITLNHWDTFFKHCPYCGKKHTFDKEG